MREGLKENILPLFLGLSACSWVPHWACHYYRLETHTSFVVGSWSFSPLESLVSLVVYGLLILLNLMALSRLSLRIPALATTGFCHLLIGSIHVYRLWYPFRFEVFGYEWSYGASLREVAIVIPFGVLCFFVASMIARQKI